MLIRTARSGFTLLEILVVIAIIGVLASLVTGAVMIAISGQRHSNTETLMRTLDKVLTQQVKAVIDKANNEALPSGQIRAAYINLRLKQEFPLNSSDLAPTPLTALATYDS